MSLDFRRTAATSRRLTKKIASAWDHNLGMGIKKILMICVKTKLLETLLGTS